MPSTEELRIAVVGGGITGLAAAHRLVELSRESNRPARITLFESGERVGGVFGTEHRDGYTLETGADSFITNKPWALDLVRRLGLEPRLISIDERARRALILRRGRLVPAPVGFKLITPSQLAPMLTTPLLSPWGKLRLCCEPFIKANATGDDESLASFVRRRFGQEFLDNIVQPIVGGIYTSDPEQLGLAATLPQFLEMERQHGSLLRAAIRQRKSTETASGARYDMFVSFQEGMSELLNALTAQICDSAEIHMGHPVTTVTPLTADGSQRYRINLADGTQCDADAVVIALPSYRAADLIEDWSRDLAAALREIEYASSAIVVSGHRREHIAHPLDAAGLVIPHREQRSVLAVSFLSRKFPSRAPTGRVILRTFVGGAMQPEFLDRDDADLTALVQSELRALLGVSAPPEICRVVRYHRAMPQYTVGHLQRVAAIEQLATQAPRLELAGNAYRGVGIPDCVHSGEQAAERIWHALV